MSFVSATLQENSPVWQNYLDLDNDVKPWLQIPAGSSQQDVRLQMLIDTACWWVQNYLSRPVAPTEFFRRYDGSSGWNGSHIMLPYFPVLEVISVVEWWGSSGPHTLAEQTPEQQGTSDMYQVVPNTGRLTRTFMGLVQRPWFTGARNVEVTWTAGYNPLPQDLRFATLVLIGHWWQHFQQASRSVPVPSGAMQHDASMMTPFSGIPVETERMLQSYKTITCM